LRKTIASCAEEEKAVIRKTCASVALVLLVAGASACGSDDSSSGDSAAATTTAAAAAPAATTEAAADTSAAPSEQPNVADASEAEAGSGEGITIGYLSNKESVPIVHAISEGIKAQDKRAGVTLVFCDGNGDNATALNCAKTFKQKKVQGIINFQHDTKAAPSICSAGPAGVPVFAVDIPQPPCQTAFMGVDNAYGGQVAGEALGQYFKDKKDCKYDAWVSLEEPEIGEPNEQRMGGYRTGFEKFCGKVHDLKKVAFDASADQGRSKTADVLTTLPSAKTIIVTSIDDEGVEGAFAAAKAAGREDQLFAASLGMADDVGRCGIKNNPNWVAATAIFPEKYGWVGIPYMIKAIKGETVGKDLFVPLVALTASNIDKYYQPSC
jgi:ribose transport system substrate-binding protein